MKANFSPAMMEAINQGDFIAHFTSERFHEQGMETAEAGEFGGDSF